MTSRGERSPIAGNGASSRYRVRLGRSADASSLLAIRHSAIVELTAPQLNAEEALAWADARDLSWMQSVIERYQVRVATCRGCAVGWLSADDNRAQGLYVHPTHARRGVGSRLLKVWESSLCDDRFSEVFLEASSNAEEFYRRQGYVVAGPRLPNGAIPLSKRRQGSRTDKSRQTTGRRSRQ